MVAPSYNQTGQLFLEVTSPSLPPPHLVRCFVVDELDRAALEHALRETTRRHGSLRTAFSLPPNPDARSLRVRTWVAADVPVAVDSLADGNGRIALDEALDAAAVAASRRFTLDQPPLLRVLAARVGRDRHLLVLVLHHLIADRWSLDLLEHELFAGYRASKEGRAYPSAATPMQYAEFARSERERLASGALDESIHFWKRQWDRYGPAQLTIRDCPFGRDHTTGSFAVEHESVVLDAALIEQMAVFVRRRRQTRHVLLLTAFVAALRQATGKDRIALFGTFANRTSVAAETAVGWFAHAHLLGAACSPDMSLDDLAGDVFRTVLDASEHQAVPPGFLWATGNAGSIRSDACVTFDYVSRHAVHRDADPRVGVVAPRPAPGHVGLRLFAVETTDGLQLVLVYSRERFDRPGIVMLLGTMRHVIELILADGSVRLGDAARPAARAVPQARRPWPIGSSS